MATFKVGDIVQASGYPMAATEFGGPVYYDGSAESSWAPTSDAVIRIRSSDDPPQQKKSRIQFPKIR